MSPARRPWLRLLGFLAPVGLLVGCSITIVSGPTTVLTHSVASYLFDLALDTGGGPYGSAGGHAYIIAEIPQDWTLASASYTGDVSGSPVSGLGAEVPDPGSPCAGLGAGPAAGMRRIFVRSELFQPLADGDVGAAELQFLVKGPVGVYQLRFWLNGTASSSSCSSPASIAVMQLEGSEHVFSDGFESGDVTMWSSTVP